MTDELEDPADDVHSQSALEGWVRVLLAQVVDESCSTHAEDGQKKTSKRLQQQIKQGVKTSSNDAKVKLQVRNSEPLRCVDESAAVCGL